MWQCTWQLASLRGLRHSPPILAVTSNVSNHQAVRPYRWHLVLQMQRSIIRWDSLLARFPDAKVFPLVDQNQLYFSLIFFLVELVVWPALPQKCQLGRGGQQCQLAGYEPSQVPMKPPDLTRKSLPPISRPADRLQGSYKISQNSFRIATPLKTRVSEAQSSIVQWSELR